MWTKTLKVGRQRTTAGDWEYEYPRLVITSTLLDALDLDVGDPVEVAVYRRRGVIEPRRAVVPPVVSRLLADARRGDAPTRPQKPVSTSRMPQER
jgi:hypothetical protein